MRPFGPPLVTRRWPLWIRYLATTVLVAFVVVVLQFWADASDHIFWLFLTVVILCAALFDRGTSWYATALSSGLLAYSGFARPDWLLVPVDVTAWILFVLVALVTSGLIELLHRTVYRLNQANEALVASEREKDLLLQETVHRVRNDFARLAAMIEIERNASEDSNLRECLQAMADRVRVFTRLQNRLRRSGNEAVVEMQDYISDLCHDVSSSVAGLKPISVGASADPHPVSEPTAVIVGLIANELVTNALKHAFPENRAGSVNVIFKSRGNECTLSVEDDGVGIPADLDCKESLGQKLVHSLVRQLQGSYEIRRGRDGSGTIASIRFQPCP